MGWVYVGTVDSSCFLKCLKEVWHEILKFRFFHEHFTPGPLSISLGPLPFFQKFVFVVGVVDNGDMMLNGVNDTAGSSDTGDDLSQVTTTPSIIYRRCQRHRQQCQQYQVACISLYECKQQPSSISTKYEKTFYLKNCLISFLAGVVDTAVRELDTKGPGGNWFMKKKNLVSGSL
jgi:hypothetical protein